LPKKSPREGVGKKKNTNNVGEKKRSDPRKSKVKKAY